MATRRQAQSQKERREELAREWHPHENGDLQLADLSDHSGQTPWWKCPQGHEWRAQMQLRMKGTNCPVCSGRQVEPGKSLGSLHPAIASQLHPELSAVDPLTIHPGSNKRLWWRCSAGHEFQAPVVSRVRYQAYAKCQGRQASDTNNLQVTHPEVAADWHPTKNGELRPSDVVAGSGKRVWWLCRTCTAEWVTRPQLRTRGKGTGCPECARREAFGRQTGSTPPLTETHPEVAAEWHPDRNAGVGAHEVTAGSAQRVWWLCQHGHEWAAIVKDRAGRQTGCSTCSGRFATPERNLAVTHPDVAAEWDYDHNDRGPQTLTPVAASAAGGGVRRATRGPLQSPTGRAIPPADRAAPPAAVASPAPSTTSPSAIPSSLSSGTPPRTLTSSLRTSCQPATSWCGGPAHAEPNSRKHRTHAAGLTRPTGCTPETPAPDTQVPKPRVPSRRLEATTRAPTVELAAAATP